jgi:tight adherence protein B
MPLNDLLSLPFDHLIMVYGSLFVGVVLLFEGLYQLAVGSRQGPEAQINRRLRMLAAGTDPELVLKKLRRADVKRSSLVERLDWWIIGTGVQISRTRLLLIMAALGLVTFAALRLTRGAPILPAAAIAAACGIGLPILYLLRRRRRRLKQFAEQLPEAIDLIVRSLRAGHPLSAGLAMVATELPDPVGSEFGIVVDETTYGLDLRDAIVNLGQRVPLPDLNYLAVAVRIQHGTGGNLAEVLSNLSKLIRERFRMFRKIHAITAEGRLSAWFLAIFPFLIAAALLLIKPDYYKPIEDDPLFPIFKYITVAMLLMNIVVMRLLVNFKF